VKRHFLKEKRSVGPRGLTVSLPGIVSLQQSLRNRHAFSPSDGLGWLDMTGKGCNVKSRHHKIMDDSVFAASRLHA